MYGHAPSSPLIVTLLLDGWSIPAGVCFSSVHIGLGATGAIMSLALLALSVFGSSLSFCPMPFLPLSTSGLFSGRFFSVFNVVRFGVVILYTFLSQAPTVRGAVGLVLVALLIVFMLRYQVFYHRVTNVVVMMFLGAAAWTFVPNFVLHSVSNSTVTSDTNRNTALFLWVGGLVPAALLGWLLLVLREARVNYYLKVFFMCFSGIEFVFFVCQLFCSALTCVLLWSAEIPVVDSW